MIGGRGGCGVGACSRRARAPTPRTGCASAAGRFHRRLRGVVVVRPGCRRLGGAAALPGNRQHGHRRLRLGAAEGRREIRRRQALVGVVKGHCEDRLARPGGDADARRDGRAKPYRPEPGALEGRDVAPGGALAGCRSPITAPQPDPPLAQNQSAGPRRNGFSRSKRARAAARRWASGSSGVSSRLSTASWAVSSAASKSPVSACAAASA